MSSAADAAFRETALALGLATEAAITAALAAERAAGTPARPLAESLVARGVLRPEQADAIRRALDGSPPVPPYAVRDAATLTTDARCTPTLPASPPAPAGLAAAPPTVPPAGPSAAPAAYIPPALAARFEIEGEIGRGGMGIVYRARQKGLDRPVALKLLGAGATSADEVRRFYREAQAAARVRHPGIVEVYDVGELDGQPYIAMELIGGCPLDRHLAQRSPSLRERVDLLRRIAEAVAYAHLQGIVHRDLKPANVLIDTEGNPHVADFGLAKELKDAGQSLTRPGAILGTPQYMSPEQADGASHSIDARSDVFSLGVMLYEILTGRRPFIGDTPLAVIVKVLCTEVVPPRKVNARIHADLDTICLRALEKDPARRYLSASALARDLAHFLAGEPIEARPTPLGYRLWKRLRKNPTVTLLAAGLVVAACAAGGVAWRAWARDRTAAQARAELVTGYRRELARSGKALVDAALARRSIGDLKGSHAFAAALEEPISELIRLAPDLAEPWYHRGRMLRALERDTEATAAQDEAVTRARAPEAGPASRAVLAPALYERGVLRALRFVELRAAKQQQFIRSRAAGELLGAAPPPLPATAELLAAFPELAEVRAAAHADLEAVPASTADGAGTDLEARVHAAHGILATLEGRDPTEAEAHLRRALAADPYLPEVYDALGHLAAERRAWDQAIACFEQACRVDRGYLPHRLSLARVLLFASDGTEAQGGDGLAQVRRGIQVLDEGLALEPGRSDAWDRMTELRLREGDVLARRGQDPDAAYQAALAAAERALALAPGMAEAHFNRAATWRAQGEQRRKHGQDPTDLYQRAIAEYAQVLAANPNLGEAANNAANAWAELGIWQRDRGEDPTGDWARARAGYEQALALNPRYAEAASNFAVACACEAAWRRGRGLDPEAAYATGIAAYDRALALDPARAEFVNRRARTWLDLGDARAGRGLDPTDCYAKALADYARTLALRPGWTEPASNETCVHVSRGDWRRAHGLDPTEAYEQALSACARILATDPKQAEAANNRALAFQGLGDWRRDRGEDPSALYTQAIGACDQALAVNPEYAGAANNRANLYLALGELRAGRGEDPTEAFEQALAGYARALALDPRLGQAECNRGNAYQQRAGWRRGHGGGAVEDCRQAIAAYARAQVLFPGLAPAAKNQATAFRLLAELEREGGGDPAEAYAKALAGFARALVLDPSDADAALQAGLTELALGRWRQGRGQDTGGAAEKALAAFDRALAADPRLWQAQANRGNVFLAQGRLEEAIAAYQEALGLCPGQPKVAAALEKARAQAEARKRAATPTPR